MPSEPVHVPALVWVLTGGIATGKSSALQVLRGLLPEAHFFDADAYVAQLYHAPEIIAEIAAALGPEVLCAGHLRRDLVRDRVLADRTAKGALESILHPRVRAGFDSLLAAASRSSSPLLIADIPLFFETGAAYPANRVITVAVSPTMQLTRLCRRTGWSPALARTMIDLQLPLEEKILRSDAVWWNQGPPAVLERQIARSCAAWTS